MSDTWLRVIGTDPGWVPDEAAADAARARLAELCPGAEAVETAVTDDVEFIDQGENLLSISCPACGAALEGDWWGERMSDAYAQAFADLAVTMPCCGAHSSLNDLAYDWPAGFARFVLQAVGPDRGWLADDELRSMADALGHPVRQIMRRI